MNSLRCANCGLRNFTDAPCCKRCKAEFGEAQTFKEAAAFNPLPQLAPYPQPQLADAQSAAEWPQPSYQPFYFPTPIAPLPRPSKYGATNAALWTMLGLAIAIGLGIAFFWKFTRPASSGYSWQEYTAKDGSYTIQMPAKPIETVDSRPSPVGTLQMNLAVADMKDRGAYLVGYVDYPAAARNAPPQDVLDGAAKGAVLNSGATLLSKKNISLDGYTGIELDMLAPPGKMPGEGRGVARIFWDAPRIYIVFVAGPKGTDFDTGATKFLDSFKLKQR